MAKTTRPLRAGRPVPPPLLTRSPEDPLLPHAIVLEENEPGAAVVLWQALQDVTLWGALPPEGRGPGLFHDEPGDAGDLLPELRADLSALGVLVRDPHPGSAAVIATVCRHVAAWAEERGRTGTALSFAHAAALLEPANPAHAHAVAKLARSRADYVGAMLWFSRAIALARRSGEREIEARCYGGLGNLYGMRGDLPLARRLHERSLWTTRRYGLREARADALFDLCMLHYVTGNSADGLRLARQALRAYGPEHARLPKLAHNVAVCWMDYQGHFEDALQVLRELLVRSWPPVDRILLVASVGRAAAGAGDRDLFDCAWIEAWTQIDHSPDREGHAEALVALARGALILNDYARASQAAQRALTFACTRREGLTTISAESVMEAVNAERRAANPEAEVSVQKRQGPDTAPVADALVKSLRRCRRTDDEIEFALAFAFTAPGDPGVLYRFARKLRNAAEYDRAEAWFRRAIDVARRVCDWDCCARSLSGLANLCRERGNRSTAVELHQEALEVARMHEILEVEGDTLLDLCVLRFEMDDGDAGFVLARQALRLYGPRHPRTPKVAYNVAVFLMVQRGDYVNALAVFRALVDCTFRPADQLLLRASIAHAAAGAGEGLLFERAWEDVRGLLARMGEDQEQHATALIEMTYAALAMGRTDWAEIACTRAHDIASSRGEAHRMTEAEELQNTIARARISRVRTRRLSNPNHDVKAAAVLARELVSALRACTASIGEDAPARAPRRTNRR